MIQRKNTKNTKQMHKILAHFLGSLNSTTTPNAPVIVNLTVLMLMGRVTDPAFLCLGMSAGQLAGFAALFGAIWLRRGSGGFQIPEADDEQNGEHVDHPVHVTESAP